MRDIIRCDICGKEVGNEYDGSKFVIYAKHPFLKDFFGLHNSEDFDICGKCINKIRGIKK